MRPRIRYAFLGRCPYCGLTPVTEKGSWFNLNTGCKNCHYRFEREPGYFSGASWMICYSIGAISAMAVGALAVWKMSDLSDLALASIPASFGAVGTFGAIPFSRAIWLYVDHTLHPLRNDERIYY